jgi:tetratricopeptide (TPR) repeat protein
MNNLAEACQTAQDLDRALPLYEQALAKCRAKLAPDHPYTLTVLDNLGTAYQDKGLLEKAMPLFEEALTNGKQKYGLDHPDVLTTMNNLAALYWAMKKPEQAIPLFEEALPRCEKLQGPEHFATIRTAFNLAMNYNDAKQLDKAIAICEQWLPRARALPAGHPIRSFGLSVAVHLYSGKGSLDKMEPVLREQADLIKQQSGADSPAYAVQLAIVGTNLLAQNKHADAEVVVRECLAIRQKKQPDDWTTFNTESMLGGALVGQKKHAEAEPLLLRGYEGMKERAAKIPPQGQVRLTQALERLVQLYSGWGKEEQAQTWRRALEAQGMGKGDAKPKQRD